MMDSILMQADTSLALTYGIWSIVAFQAGPIIVAIIRRAKNGKGDAKAHVSVLSKEDSEALRQLVEDSKDGKKIWSRTGSDDRPLVWREHGMMKAIQDLSRQVQNLRVVLESEHAARNKGS